MFKNGIRTRRFGINPFWFVLIVSTSCSTERSLDKALVSEISAILGTPCKGLELAVQSSLSYVGTSVRKLLAKELFWLKRHPCLAVNAAMSVSPESRNCQKLSCRNRNVW